jgi:hypothetical protein
VARLHRVAIALIVLHGAARADEWCADAQHPKLVFSVQYSTNFLHIHHDVGASLFHVKIDRQAMDVLPGDSDTYIGSVKVDAGALVSIEPVFGSSEFCIDAIDAGDSVVWFVPEAAGTIHGVVTDPTGHHIVGARVVATATSGKRFTARTTSNGSYMVADLPFDDYAVDFSYRGAQTRSQYVKIEMSYPVVVDEQLEPVVVSAANPIALAKRTSRDAVTKDALAQASDAIRALRLGLTDCDEDTMSYWVSFPLTVGDAKFDGVSALHNACAEGAVHVPDVDVLDAALAKAACDGDGVLALPLGDATWRFVWRKKQWWLASIE